MHDHAEILELAAAGIDFDLDPAEHVRLEAALAECPMCRRRVGEMRASATILRRGSDIGTPGRVRDVVIRAALNGGGGRRAVPAFRLAVGLALALVLVPATIYVGGRLVNTTPSVSPSVPAPTPVSSTPPTVTPAPSATPGPSATPAPSESSGPSEPPAPSASGDTSAPSGSLPPVATGPLAPGDVAAMVTGGVLVIRTQPGKSPDSAIFKTTIHPGQRVLVLEGPVEASGYPWYRIRLGDIEGWSAAQGVDGEPWLAPVRNGVIAFVRKAGDGSGEAIVTADAAGTGTTVLVSDPGLVEYEQPSWSPDGRRLAFVARPVDAAPGAFEIFVVDADGTDLARLTRNDVLDDSPAWSPDGTKIAFRRADPSSEIFVMSATGSGVRGRGVGSNPVWSPDGLQLALTAPDGGSEYLWVQAADGSGRRRVSEIPAADEPPAWSPDALRLVFTHAAAGAGLACRLCVAVVASGSTTPLTVEDGTAPAWSITGPIAFSTTGALSGVYVIQPDGTGRRRISADLKEPADLSWSPNGRRALFSAGAPSSSIAVVDADGGGLTLVADQTYVVVAGDTLARIAKAWGLSLENLLAANPQIKNPDQIAVGDELVIPTSGAIDGSPAWQPLLP